MRCPEATDSEGLDFTKALKHFSIIMNKRKRAARNRKRINQAEQVGNIMDRSGIAMYNTYERVRIHNQLASRGVGMVVDAVWVSEYYERRTFVRADRIASADF